jgi:hypothetical protein
MRNNRTDQACLAIHLVDGWIRHTFVNDNATQLAHDEINGGRVKEEKAMNSATDSEEEAEAPVVYGFQYNATGPSGCLRLLAIPPSGIPQEVEHPEILGSDIPLASSVTLGPSNSTILVHELCVFPQALLTIHQMVQVHRDLTARWSYGIHS